MSEKTHWKKIVSDPNFIGEGDFQDGEEKIVTIKTVNQNETVTTAEGKSQKAVMHFAETGIKPMILNVARSKSIEKVAGSPYFEDWVGIRVQLYIEKGIKAFGDIVNAVRVRNFKPKAAAPVPPCSDCGGAIVADTGKSAEFYAAYGQKRHGAPLCADCLRKRKEAAAAQEPTTSEEAEQEAPNDSADE